MLSRLFKRPEERQAEQQKVQESLTKTRRGLFSQIGGLFQTNELSDETWDDLEALLIQADVGGETSAKLVERMRKRVQTFGIKRATDAQAIFEQELVNLLNEHQPPKDDMERLLTIVMVVGVNGSGKTTSIGKLARLYKQAGYKVVIAAADTFRAAAIDQIPRRIDLLHALFPAHAIGLVAGVIGMPAHAQRIDQLLRRCGRRIGIDTQHAIGLGDRAWHFKAAH